MREKEERRRLGREKIFPVCYFTQSLFVVVVVFLVSPFPLLFVSLFLSSLSFLSFLLSGEDKWGEEKKKDVKSPMNTLTTNTEKRKSGEGRGKTGGEEEEEEEKEQRIEEEEEIKD